MIVRSSLALQIGYQGVGLMDHFGTPHTTQPYVVLRLATLEEWIVDVQSIRGLSRPSSRDLPFLRQSFYYAVSVD